MRRFSNSWITSLFTRSICFTFYFRHNSSHLPISALDVAPTSEITLRLYQLALLPLIAPANMRLKSEFHFAVY